MVNYYNNDNSKYYIMGPSVLRMIFKSIHFEWIEACSACINLGYVMFTVAIVVATSLFGL